MQKISLLRKLRCNIKRRHANSRTSVAPVLCKLVGILYNYPYRDNIEYMFVLSKTDYLIYRECSKNAWLKIHCPDVYKKAELSEFDKAIIETGNEVEKYARELFPGGVMIEGRDSQAQTLTLKYIVDKTPVIFQPVFLKDGFLAAVDILKFDSGTKGYFFQERKSC